MEIKHRKKKKGRKLTPFEKLVRDLKRDLKEAQDDAITAEEKRHLNDGSKAFEDHINEKRRLARIRVVKKYRRDVLKLVDYIDGNYSDEINYSKEKRYPLQWQLNDKRIARTFKERPIIPDFLNYLFNYNRWGKGKRRKMEELIKSVMGREAFEEAYKNPDVDTPLYAVFKADADFWEAAADTLGYSESWLKTVLGEFQESEIVIRRGSVATDGRGRPPGVYADGYFADKGGILVKHPFLKNNKQYRNALRRMCKKN